MVLQRDDCRRNPSRIQSITEPMDSIQQPSTLCKRVGSRLNSPNLQHIHDSSRFDGCWRCLPVLSERQNNIVFFSSANIWSWSIGSRSFPNKHTTHTWNLSIIGLAVWCLFSHFVFQKTRSTVVIHFYSAWYCIVCYINSVLSLSGIGSE